MNKLQEQLNSLFSQVAGKIKRLIPILQEIYLRPARIIYLVFQLYKDKKIPSLAQSLAYTTIISLVPIFAIFFSILGLITERESVKQNIKNFIEKYFFPQYGENIFLQLEKLASSSLAVGVIGIPTLFIVGILLYSKVDCAFNTIWETENQRKWVSHGIVFLTTVFMGPMLLILAFSVPTYLNSLPLYKTFISVQTINTLMSVAIPILVSTLILLILYLYIPAKSVQVRAALIGAFFGALFHQVSNLLVNWYLVNISNFNIIYGSLAIIPIILLWIFWFWTVVLTGNALSYIIHTHSSTGYMLRKDIRSDESLLHSTISVLLYIVQTFQEKNGAPDFDQMYLILGINKKRLELILKILHREKVITSYGERTRYGNKIFRYQPGISPTNIYLKDLLRLFYKTKENLVFNESQNKILDTFAIPPGAKLNTINFQDLTCEPEKLVDIFIPENINSSSFPE